MIGHTKKFLMIFKKNFLLLLFYFLDRSATYPQTAILSPEARYVSTFHLSFKYRPIGCPTKHDNSKTNIKGRL